MSIPLYRLEAEFRRLGIPLSRATMTDQFRRAARKLMILRQRLIEWIRASRVVHADETKLKLTAQKAKAYMWAFVSEHLTLYEFALSRGGEVAVDVLGDSPGVLVCDDYRGYDPTTNIKKRKRAGCLAHARRKFFEANKDGVPEAEMGLSIIGMLYAVEREASCRESENIDDRLALRQQFSRPLFAELLRLCRAIRRAHGPKTLLARATRYTLKNRKELTLTLGDASIPPDNNRAENAERFIAVGRKNFLFVQSEEAGKELALLYSFVVSCDRLGKNPTEYLTDVLRRIDDVPKSKLAELLPHRWQPPSKPPPSAPANIVN